MTMTDEEKVQFDSAVARAAAAERQVEESKKYASERDALAQKTSAHIGKVKGYVEGLGIGQFDDKFNFIPAEKPQAPVVDQTSIKLTEIDSELKLIKKQMDAGDLDVSDYYEKRAELTEERAELKATKIAQEAAAKIKRELDERQQKADADATVKIQNETQKQSRARKMEAVKQQYPDSEVVGSALFNEMQSVLNATPDLYDEPNTNPVARVALAQQAYINLLQRGEADKVTKRVSGNQFHTMQPSPYEKKPDEDEGIKEEMGLIRNGIIASGLNAEQAAAVEKNARNALKTNEWVIKM